MEKMEASDAENGGGAMHPAVDTQMKKLLDEKLHLDGGEFPNANRLIDDELKKIVESQKPTFDRRFIDLFHNKPVKISAKILVPAAQFPHVNYVGKLLGFKGATLKHLQEITDCRMFILGKGSMKNKEKEEEFINSGDPKYAHLSDVLHVEITCLAPPTEVYDKMSFAVNTLRKFLTPDPVIEFPLEGLRRAPDEEAPIRGKSNVLNLVEKARHSMAATPPTFRRGRGFPRGPGKQPSRGLPYQRRDQNPMSRFPK